MADDASDRRRLAAEKYRPHPTRLLLVAESPPKDLRRYFYFEQMDSHDHLFEHVCEVLFGERPHHNKPPFLSELQRRGVFVVDLLSDGPRNGRKLGPAVQPFLERLKDIAPERIIVIKADVCRALCPKLKEAGYPATQSVIPFPASGQQEKFRQAFRDALKRGGLDGLIRPLPTA